MRIHFILTPFFIAYLSGLNALKAQVAGNAINTIKNHSRQWDAAFNTRDTTSYYSLIDSAIAVTAGGGTDMGSEIFRAITNSLYTRRPDIRMNMTIKNVELNKQWNVAYDTGDWREGWTQQNDKTKSLITGKYWRMWKLRDNKWKIMAMILTPLACRGSYCK